MLISFTQSGGFAGLVRAFRVDTKALDPAERTRVEAFVAAAGWTESCTRFSEGRDRFQYEISIEGDAAPVHVVCDDSCVPPDARPLVAYLKERAK